MPVSHIRSQPHTLMIMQISGSFELEDALVDPTRSKSLGYNLFWQDIMLGDSSLVFFHIGKNSISLPPVYLGKILSPE
jgi:hypothetical protein